MESINKISCKCLSHLNFRKTTNTALWHKSLELSLPNGRLSLQFCRYFFSTPRSDQNGWILEHYVSMGSVVQIYYSFRTTSRSSKPQCSLLSLIWKAEFYYTVLPKMYLLALAKTFSIQISRLREDFRQMWIFCSNCVNFITYRKWQVG